MSSPTHTTATRPRVIAPALVPHTCPKCDQTIDTLPSAQVSHRCPMARGKWVDWKENQT